jgi:hypothetical protein
MTRGLNMRRGAGWTLVTAVVLGVLIGRFAVPRRTDPADARPVRPPRPGPRRTGRPEAPQRAPGLLLGDDELRRLAEREEAWW